jgi:hypothetical protein
MPSTTRSLISQPLSFGLDMDSDDVEAALALANLTPDCPIDQALKAIVIWLDEQMRPRAGAPRGNINRSVPDPRDYTVRFRVNAEELTVLERSAGGESVGTWVRNLALEAARQKEN